MSIKYSIHGLFCLLSLLTCQGVVANDSIVPRDSKASVLVQERKALLQHSIRFNIDNAYDKKYQVFYSDLDNEGRRLSRSVHLVSLSRMIYALSFSSEYFPQYLGLAQQSAKFILKHMIAMRDGYQYFIPEWYSTNGSQPVMPEVSGIDIWQQAYGFNGLVELYRHWPDAELLAAIRRMHRSFVHHFYDAVHGGFYDYYDFSSGTKNSGKKLQTVIYPLSAYMANLWHVDPEKLQYQSLLGELLQLAYDKLWDEASGWVNVDFNAGWQPCVLKSHQCEQVMPGHNFQLAWTLMRSKDWMFIDESLRKKYWLKGKHIVDVTLSKPIWDGNVANGFFRQVHRKNNKITSQRKSWWQHSEAIIALSLLGTSYDKPLRELEDFFQQYFVDRKHGGEYFFLDGNNKGIASVPKTSKGKSSYHTVEMLRYLLDRSSNAG